METYTFSELLKGYRKRAGFTQQGLAEQAELLVHVQTVKGWENGFGEQVLGETWVSHWGKHKKEACRTHVEASNKGHAILKGVGQIFCTSDVYEAHPLAPSTMDGPEPERVGWFKRWFRK